MRRMYSEQELSVIVYQVMGQYIENGAFNQTIDNYIDAYLLKHPVDPTAITGLDIAPKDVTASGNITAPSIIENMSSEYNFVNQPVPDGYSKNFIYGGIVKNGNKITIVIFGSITRISDSPSQSYVPFARAHLPHSVMEKIIPYTISGQTIVSSSNVSLFNTYNNSVSKVCACSKIEASDQLLWSIYSLNNLAKDTTYFIRIEQTFLLSENLAI